MKINLFAIAIVSLSTLVAFTTAPKSSPYKCLIQLKNYEGEGAYVVVSLLDQQKFTV